MKRRRGDVLLIETDYIGMVATPWVNRFPVVSISTS